MYMRDYPVFRYKDNHNVKIKIKRSFILDDLGIFNAKKQRHEDAKLNINPFGPTVHAVFRRKWGREMQIFICISRPHLRLKGHDRFTIKHAKLYFATLCLCFFALKIPKSRRIKERYIMSAAMAANCDLSVLSKKILQKSG